MTSAAACGKVHEEVIAAVQGCFWPHDFVDGHRMNNIDIYIL